MLMRRSASIAFCGLAATIGFTRPTHASPLPGEGAGVEMEAGPAASTVVGNTGDARWTVPIELPPGPGGFAPTVALQYSSSRGDGPFGVGWDLPTGSVTCSTRFGVPAYVLTGAAACPRFDLDGGLLNDAGGGRYHTFVESFQRVLHVTSGGQDHWEVTSPDGVIRRYGTGPNSRITGPGNTIVRWLLAEVENPYGQKIHYGYDGNPADPDLDPPTTGFTYLATIAYGPSSGGSNPEREVVVSYETRPDPIRDYAGGVLRHVAFRASAIEVRSYGALHSRHVLGWSQADGYATHRSRLASVQRVGSDAESTLPAQEFRYTDAGDSPGPEWQEAAYEDGLRPHPQHFGFLVGLSSWPTAFPPPVRTGDINGDGLVDIIESSSYTNGGHGVWLNTGDGFEASPEWFAELGSLEFTAPRIDVIYAGNDIDVCGVEYSSVQQKVGFGDRRFDFPIAVDISQQNEYTLEEPEEAFVEILGNFHLADLNGDGLSDLVMALDLSGMYITHDCNGVPLDPPVYTTPPEPEVRVAFRNTGTGWVPDPSLVVGLPPFGIVFTEGGAAHMDIWKGGSFECDRMIGSAWHKAYPLNWDMAVYPCINFSVLAPEFTDFNGDGRLDLVVAALDEDRPTLIVTNEFDPSSPEHSDKIESTAITTHSRVWISQLDGSWSPDPSFDLSLPRFRGHPRSHESAVGVCHGETEETSIFG